MNFNTEIENNKNNFFLNFKYRIKNFKTHDWVALIGLFVFSISIVLTIMKFFDYIQGQNESWKIFFGIIDRFTYQSNWLLFIYALFYVFNPKCFIFKNNYLLICVMTYITFTFVGYNIVLVGIAKSHSYADDVGVDIFNNVWLHLVSPLYFIVFGMIKMFMLPNQQPKSIYKTIGFGMIYPLVYVTYLIIIPFAFTDYRTNGINYGNIDNNPYSVYDFATNTYSNPTSWAYILSMLLIFFPSVFTGYYFLWRFINKLTIK